MSSITASVDEMQASVLPIVTNYRNVRRCAVPSTLRESVHQGFLESGWTEEQLGKPLSMGEARHD
jgi:hypothetical protein